MGARYVKKTEAERELKRTGIPGKRGRMGTFFSRYLDECRRRGAEAVQPGRHFGGEIPGVFLKCRKKYVR